MEDRAGSNPPGEGTPPDTEAQLLEQIRDGDTDAGRRFVREQYPAVYRYLLYLTGRPELAEDLTQETFLQAWRHLHSFERRASLRAWLHRIAHREFLQALRSRRFQTSLQELAGMPEPHGEAWADAIELREVIDRLPLEERQVMLLHYLEGYTSAEIALILDTPASTVRRRLAQARERLRQELGEGDLPYLNQPHAPMQQWHWLPLDQIHALETRLATETGREEKEMERREFLRYTAAGAAGLVLPDAGKEIVDGRLTQKVTLALKATALVDVCEHLRSAIGVHLTAGASVADEKVTLFCKQLPLREVMRQLSRPFGYTWLRSREQSVESREPGEAAYRYELAQDLRSQLLEEELRNRDRNAALLALEREIERYRPYLGLSPDEALARSQSEPPAEKALLEILAGRGWGPIQLYFRLSAQELAALRSGQELTLSGSPDQLERRLPLQSERGVRPLPSEIERGVLQSLRHWRLIRKENTFRLDNDATDPRGVALHTVPEAHGMVKLSMSQAEPGQFVLRGSSGVWTPGAENEGFGTYTFTGGNLASGRSPAQPAKPAAPAATRDPALRRRVTVQLSATGSQPPPKVTTADVLEALHRETGMPIVADFYTRLHEPQFVSCRDLPLSQALGQLAEAMRLRWQLAENNWLQFRSISFYHDRLKEVPNRLLSRWTAARRQRGHLSLHDLAEIAALSDAQLDAREMAEGARELWGLREWHLACYAPMRPHLRFLVALLPAQRDETMEATGLGFRKMTLPQQQQFIALALQFDRQPLGSLTEMDGAALRVVYTQPGAFQWGNPDDYHVTRWAVPLEAGPEGRRVPRPLVVERSREAVLAGIHRIDPQIRDAIRRLRQQDDPRLSAYPTDEAEIYPTKLALTIVTIPSATNARSIHIWHENSDIGY